MTTGAIPVTARLVAVWIAVVRLLAILDRFFRDVIEDFATHHLILLDLLALATSAIGHEGLLGKPQLKTSKRHAMIVSAMEPYEQLGLFYLGKRFDLATRSRTDEHVLYESKHLVTHAVCVGMTGSGKTGLGIAIIEEAALDGIPVLAIDPKGDLANLLLTFPALTADEFAPWVAKSESAAAQAEAWRAGLADWGQDAERIERLRTAARARVYTPGSRAGTPLALLKSLTGGAADDDREAAAVRVGATADSILALAGISDANPHNRERVLLASLLQHAAESGQTVDLPWVVQQVQKPGIDRIGILDLDTFYPARDRQELALRLNAVLAAPGFDVWLAGEPMDVGRLLYTPAGQPRVAIVSIAHLGDAERMLVVSLILNEVLAWTRAQSGTTSLRALVYMDEIAGYFPPVANPPSKAPLLTLLKQARAFGVGVMLSAQNPVDLDYKGLANAGTWFLGKLQTERDKTRVLDGLEGAAVGGLDRAAFDTLLSTLRSRIFLLHNVHEREPIVFQTRWTLSYLRGPMTKEDIRRLTPPTPQAQTLPARPSRPVAPAGMREFFLPGTAAIYEPRLYGSARVTYGDGDCGGGGTEDVHAIVRFGSGAVTVDWHDAERIDIAPEALLAAPAASDAGFAHPPAPAMETRRYTTWEREFERWVLQSQRRRVFKAPRLGITSRPGESERDFRIRLQQARHERRDADVEALRAKYAPRLARLGERLTKAQDAVVKERQQAGQQKLQSAVSIGATVVGALLGRKAISASTLGRATTAARGMSRAAKEAEDVTRAETRATELQEEVAAMERDLEREIDSLAAMRDEAVETVEIKPSRAAVEVRLVALVWAPSTA